MAATQAESQQNDVNCEQVQSEQSRDRNVLQNGTGESVGRGLVGSDILVNPKTKSSSQNTLGVEMSQYRQESGAGPPILNSSGNGEPNESSTSVDNKTNTDNKTFTQNSDQCVVEQGYGKGSESSGQNLQGFGGLGFTPRGNYHQDHGASNQVQNSSENNQSQNNPFSQFSSSQTMRHGYQGSKLIPTGSMNPTRPSSVGPNINTPSGNFPTQQQQRFQSGQTIPQQAGPTPTLNQLLQQSNPVHRYQNNFGDYRMPKVGEQGNVNVPYNQSSSSWTPNRPSYGPQQAASMPPVITMYSPSQVRESLAQLHLPHFPEDAGPQQPARPPGAGVIAAAFGGDQRGVWRKGVPSLRSPQPSPSPGQAGAVPYMQQPVSGQNAHAPDAGDLAGQNSNDSSSGPAPGTPNSQGMRPTPSPTGSTGSRSMSPAVGQQNVSMPPRPSSGQSDGGGSTRMSHSPMAAQSGYQQPLAHPPHLHGYKIPGQQMPSYTPQPQQYPQGNFNQRPQGQIGSVQYGQGYGPTNQQNPQANNMGPGQYTGRGMPNHVPPQQFSYQGWGGPGMNQPPGMMGVSGSQMVAKGTGPQSSASSQAGNANSGPRPHTPPHYLKQHLQQKLAFSPSAGSSMSPNAANLQGYGAGPGMGPPAGMHHSSMGPPSLHPGVGAMGPPSSAPAVAPPAVAVSNPSPLPNSHHDGPMPPPATAANSHPSLADAPDSAHDNGHVASTTTVAGTTATNVTPSASGSVTSVVTTGPDGAPLDEGSQQSTLSNASAASGEDPSCTPKSRKDGSVVGNSGGYLSHPPTPQSTVPSPGQASLNSMHEEYGDVNSPSWPRTPASPVFNSHAHQDPYRAKKPDSLCKLYEMDENHERRIWLDKLLQFMEERGTPISACPTISKNPLDLFRLYLYVKERGGFMEVTKNKTWKDIAGLLGIGASSSAAYTLRKHYTKNLLAYECHFDRGGIDPQPIINQVEATSKKKGVKATSVPSPGSSNSQDSFPAAGSSGGGSMDGYGYGYPPGGTSDYGSQTMQRPASQSNAPSPHTGVGVPTQGAGDNISVSNPFDDVAPGQRPNPYCPSGGPSRPQGMQQGYQAQAGYAQYQDQYGHSRGPPTNIGQEFNQQYPPSSSYASTRPMYPPYGPEGDRGYQQQGPTSSQPTPSGQDPYNHNRYMTPGQPPGYPSRAGYPAPPSGPPSQQPVGYPGQQDYYRPDPMSQSLSFPTSQLARQLVAPQSPVKTSYQQVYPGQQPPTAGGPGSQMYPGSHSKTMPPPAPQTPRRHPDFDKNQQQASYPQYGQQRPMYGWSSSNSQYRGQYPPQGPVPQGPPQWNQSPQRPGGPVGGQPANNQWEQHRYPPSGQTPYQPPQQSQPQWVSNMPNPNVGQNSMLRPPILSPRPPFRPEGKPYQMPQLPGSKGQPPGSQGYPQQAAPKREIVFPPDSVEATLPVFYKRKRMTRGDVAPVEAWRLMMSLRSGLLAESAWALDILNILLFDDTTVAYFGLAHMPGLLDVLLEHFRRSLADMFDSPASSDADKKWYQLSKAEIPDVDLGSVREHVDPSDRVSVMESTPNYTLLTRKNQTVKVVNRDGDIFVLDTRRNWDVDGDVSENMSVDVAQDPWQLASTDGCSTKYIVACFQGEFGNVPFARLLPGAKTNSIENGRGGTKGEDDADFSTSSDTMDATDDSVEHKGSADDRDSNDRANDGNANKETDKDCPRSERKNCDKKKRNAKTINAVLSRIKKEPAEANDVLTREIQEKVVKNEVQIKKECSESVGNSVDGKYSRADKSPAEKPDGLENDDDGSSDGSFDVSQIKKEDIFDDSEIDIKTESIPNHSPETKREDAKTEGIKVRDPAGTLKRRRMSDYEDECYARDEASLYLVTETQDLKARRCVCLSNILRNLTFVPGNEAEFAKNGTFLALLGKLLLLHHEHPPRAQKQRNYDREEDADFADSCSSLQGEGEWWWDFLHVVRENVLVTAANIAGHMDLGQHPEEVSRPVIDGLLHWAVCPAAHGQDPFPGSSGSLSPQRLALEALCKLCVTDSNVDLVVATPPYSRLERLCAVLTRLLCRSEEQVLREFAVNLLHYLAAADSGVARTVAMQSPCVSLLVAFIEQAESTALGVANQHGIAALRDNPDAMGTSLDMLRRAAGTLLHLARHPDNRPLFLQQEQRLLSLVMSQILDQQVAAVISSVLFQCSRPSS